MNPTIVKFARETIKQGLKTLTDDQRMMFKRIYSPQHLDRPIEVTVDVMPEYHLDWALSQVEATQRKNLKQKAQAFANAAESNRNLIAP